jgi:D-alanyl-D-alanine carboxypeptidase
VVDMIPGTSLPYLPNTAEYNVPYKSRITIRHLLGHRAGVFDVSNDKIPEDTDAPYAGMSYIDYVRETQGQDDHTFTFDELVSVVAQNKLSYWPPGEGFHYSNTGYSMLGKIIERVSGLPYSEYVRKTFVAPLGLTGTGFPDRGTETALPSPHVDGYTLFGGNVYETTDDNMSPHVAEGNVITTPRDLSRWITFLLSGRAGVDMQTARTMMDVFPTGEHHVWYGLGITKTPGLGYGHNGGHAGYMTVMRYDPEDRVTVVIFASVLAGDDLLKQGEFLINVARKAKEIAGYSGD